MVLPLALTTMVFAPITANYFYGDDLLAVYQVANAPLLDLLIEPYGGHVQTTRNLAYLGHYALFGPAPAVYYTIVLLTHLANVALLFALVRQLTKSARLGAFAAALWGAAPVNEGALGWYSVYGQVLVVTALLWILSRLAGVAERGRLAAGELALWGVLLFAASTSFGIGVGLTAAMPAVAWLLLPAGSLRRRAVVGLGIVAVLVVGGYVGLLRLAARLYPGFTQFGMLLDGLHRFPEALALGWRMGAFGLKGLLLGPLAQYVERTAWETAALTVAGIVAVTLAYAAADSRCRRRMLAVLLLCTVCYGAIATGRVLFYPAMGERLVQAERYHYAAPLWLAMLASLALVQLDAWWRPAAWLKSAALAGWALTFAVAQLVIGRGVDHHLLQRQLADEALAAMRAVIVAQPPGQDVYLTNQTFYGVGPLVVKNPQTFPGWAALFAVYHAEPVVDGRRVHFVEADRQVLNAAARGRRSAGLLVGPDDVPTGGALELPRAVLPASLRPPR